MIVDQILLFRGLQNSDFEGERELANKIISFRQVQRIIERKGFINLKETYFYFLMVDHFLDPSSMTGQLSQKPILKKEFKNFVLLKRSN